MTESELLANSEFLAWCRVWEAERWCPAAFADWCGDRDFWQGYEACVWAHEKEERKGWRVYPGYYAWVTSRFSDEYPWNVPVLGPCNLKRDESFPAAIAYYLTHFDAQLAKKYPPQRALATV